MNSSETSRRRIKPKVELTGVFRNALKGISRDQGNVSLKSASSISSTSAQNEVKAETAKKRHDANKSSKATEVKNVSFHAEPVSFGNDNNELFSVNSKAETAEKSLTFNKSHCELKNDSLFITISNFDQNNLINAPCYAETEGLQPQDSCVTSCDGTFYQAHPSFGSKLNQVKNANGFFDEKHKPQWTWTKTGNCMTNKIGDFTEDITHIMPPVSPNLGKSINFKNSNECMTNKIGDFTDDITYIMPPVGPNLGKSIHFKIGNESKNRVFSYDLPKTSPCIRSSSPNDAAYNQNNENFYKGNELSSNSADTGYEGSSYSEQTEGSLLTNRDCSETNSVNFTDIDGLKSNLEASIEPKQIEAISEFLQNIEIKHAVSNGTAHKVIWDLNRVFKNCFEGNTVDLYGSYQSGLAISTSNINIVIQSDKVKNSFMPQVHKVLCKELPDYHILPPEDVSSSKKYKISFFEPYTSVACDLTYLGRSRRDSCKINSLLKTLCFHDKRVRTLIIATRVWAEACDMHEAENGKLHPLAFALMVIHFLQQYKKPLLPVIDTSMDLKELRPISSIDMSVGELWLAFLKYYGYIFKWSEYVVTITDEQPILKKSRTWKPCWIAVEDPYSKKNIAESITNHDVAHYIQSCFKCYYHYFLSPVNDVEPYRKDSDNQEHIRKWNFSFDACDIQQKTPISCETCGDLDTTCEDCETKNILPLLNDFPKMSLKFLKIIDETLKNVYDEYLLSDEKIQKRKGFVVHLQKYIQRIFQDAELFLIGSSVNGFGFVHSDLDICMTFKSKSQEEINTFQRLKFLCSHLRRHGDLAYVRFLPSAHVPIIKFFYKPNGYRCDISLYNLLAIHNSELLRTYSVIDDRCRVLGCALKLLAKKACIADAVNKTLSSYSYILMTIHFLQQTDPPVLPILQDSKLFKGGASKPVKMVENCNVWFLKDSKAIEDLWVPKNEKFASELWLDLLYYYATLNFQHVITIRQREPMDLAEKQNSSKCFRAATLFNIEDPFILSKNLGSVVSDKGANAIRSVFIRALEIFRTPLYDLPNGISHFKDYFFSPANLTKKFIRDIECAICGKIGHRKDDCREGFLPRKTLMFRRFHNYKYGKPRRFT